ncbi:NAD(P)/FAD-dependent oxidoreductase [Candidatus Micrarchaeota archaeon]|jgi:flavin-dependent dehydrogenase|nr:NAD(P)/FAD-dependent oxidoreductase [Candidatus Micrarchaeota archaeon]
MNDIHIIGAGPAGCFAAIHSLKHNPSKKILISEEHNSIGLPVKCSGLISKNAVDFLSKEINIKKCIKKKFTKAEVNFGNEKLELRSKQAMYLINRQVFDRLCAEKAEQLGAKIELNTKIINKYKSKTIIGADGPLSITAEYFKFPKISKFIATQQANINLKDFDQDTIQIFLSQKYIPGFFGWLIPQNEEETELGVGVRIPKDGKLAMDYLKLQLDIKQKLSLKGGLIPHEIRKKTYKLIGKKNIFLVGDSAGQVKRTTGGGIYYGCLCAQELAKSIDTPKNYEKNWRKKYEKDLKMLSFLRSFINIQNDLTLKAGLKSFKVLGIERLIEKHGDPDSIGSLIDSMLRR